MGDLSKNFSRHEFACHCGCGLCSPDPALLDGLQALRELVGHPIQILSGCRCKAHNAAVGGVPNSLHVAGKAADVRCYAIPVRRLYETAAAMMRFGGLGVDDQRQFLHVDTRPITARWCYLDGRESPWRDAPQDA